MTDAGAWSDPTTTPEYLAWQQARQPHAPIAHRIVTVLYWVGGLGYVPTKMFKVWDPEHPQKWHVITPEEFEALRGA